MTRREERENIYRILFREEFHAKEEMPEQTELAIEGIAGAPAFDEEGAYIHGSTGITEEEAARIRERLSGILRHLDEIDAAVSGAAEGWSISRIGKSELAILRLAVFEMRYDEDVPVGVAINEAVELSKIYCGEEARAFINGILGKLSGERS